MIGNQFQVNKSFKQWCIENNLNELLQLWDYEKNLESPSEVGFGSNKKFYFRCSKHKHPSEKHYLSQIIKSKKVPCKQCNSIGQYIIDNYGEDYLWKHWSSNNSNNPFAISKGSGKKIWIHCTKKSYHPDYLQEAKSFAKGCRCPYCTSKIILPQDSLASKFPKSINYWSNKNPKSPYEYSAHSGDEVWWKCSNGIHEDYQRKISNSVEYDFRCPVCSKEEYKKQAEDLTQYKFGRLSPICINKSKSNETGKTYWLCKCDCGRYVTVHANHLKSGKIKSCGCLHREIISGVQHWDWNAPTPARLRKEIRNSDIYKEWREAVLERDRYTCQCCGSKENLHVHHKNNFVDFPEQRFVIANGITLCKKCHFASEPDSFHKIYGTRGNTEEQLIEYLNIYGKFDFKTI